MKVACIGMGWWSDVLADAIKRSGPAARARPSAWATSSVWPTAPFDPVPRLFEAAQTALVVAEWTVWNLPPSMRSSSIKLPPASTMATDTASFSASALAMAVAMIFFAPAMVRRFESATYMLPPAVYISACL